jgi:hypothetical protein
LCLTNKTAILSFSLSDAPLLPNNTKPAGSIKVRQTHLGTGGLFLFWQLASVLRRLRPTASERSSVMKG